MAREATSAHLDSMMHVYDNGTTARLYVTPWDRNTVADGYWQTVNTIQPLINRDIYLANAIDKLANEYAVYSGGYGIIISTNEQDGTNYISVDPTVDFTNVPSYNFDNRYFTYNVVDNTATVGFKIDDNYIKTRNDGIFCNIDYLLYETRNVTSYSSITAKTSTAYTYEYSTASQPFSVDNTLPHMPNEGTIYCVG